MFLAACANSDGLSVRKNSSSSAGATYVVIRPASDLIERLVPPADLNKWLSGDKRRDLLESRDPVHDSARTQVRTKFSRIVKDAYSNAIKEGWVRRGTGPAIINQFPTERLFAHLPHVPVAVAPRLASSVEHSFAEASLDVPVRAEQETLRFDTSRLRVELAECRWHPEAPELARVKKTSVLGGPLACHWPDGRDFIIGGLAEAVLAQSPSLFPRFEGSRRQIGALFAWVAGKSPAAHAAYLAEMPDDAGVRRKMLSQIGAMPVHLYRDTAHALLQAWDEQKHDWAAHECVLPDGKRIKTPGKTLVVDDRRLGRVFGLDLGQKNWRGAAAKAIAMLEQVQLGFITSDGDVRLGSRLCSAVVNGRTLKSYRSMPATLSTTKLATALAEQGVPGSRCFFLLLSQDLEDCLWTPVPTGPGTFTWFTDAKRHLMRVGDDQSREMLKRLGPEFRNKKYRPIPVQLWQAANSAGASPSQKALLLALLSEKDPSGAARDKDPYVTGMTEQGYRACFFNGISTRGQSALG